MQKIAALLLVFCLCGTYAHTYYGRGMMGGGGGMMGMGGGMFGMMGGGGGGGGYGMGMMGGWRRCRCAWWCHPWKEFYMGRCPCKHQWWKKLCCRRF